MKIISSLLAYLIGSIPTGFIIFYLSEKKDIRNFGSRSTGATNVLRLKGWKYGLVVFGGDFLKGFLTVFATLKIFNDLSLAAICGLLAVAGHCFPVYIKFKGGKGVATTI
ncbi:MAG: glycerol-3-phosphate acyltransferase, partial [Candidatus Aminicenantales bacterium]